MAPKELSSREIGPVQIEEFRRAFEADPRFRASLNAVTKTSVNNVAMNREAVTRIDHTFSHIVKAGPSTSQNSSGRCWMFAGLNTFRMAAAKQMGMEDFELSQNYPMFWDKLEKANYFLENILSTLDEDTDSRLIAWLLNCPIQDGGQWDMFVSLVEKYGLVPKVVMPETDSSSNTRWMNERVTEKLREYACRLRHAHRQGVALATLRTWKGAMLEEVYRMLAIHLGEPPQNFNWQWRDKDGTFHRDGVVSPQQFRESHVPIKLDPLVCLIHCPQPAKSFNTVYTINYLGNVVDGQPIRYLNVEIDILKAAAIAMIKDEKPVWFGCDVGKRFDRDLGIMDVELYDYTGVYGMDASLDKGQRLDYGQSQMTHAMVLTGVDLDDDGRSAKWRVENSWGDKGGDKGFMVMTDAWFEEYLYEVAVEKSYLSPEHAALLETEPVGLPPWDPMGALAGGSRD